MGGHISDLRPEASKRNSGAPFMLAVDQAEYLCPAVKCLLSKSRWGERKGKVQFEGRHLRSCIILPFPYQGSQS